ncbi:zinc finger CCHC domain-containing protein 4 [Caerostris extrusa]|uniref:Zinc finger CCHC domain-containing protein 4 n=1 Tax=Caerostris extrusa TaxID=172846 RepID=A0AAV4Q9H9_CAEEX|nr:zinc finger CCHC domain-containing protein 4 [Caerostris extrusa]
MEVIPKNCKKHPSCPHGPCLMLERQTSTKRGKKVLCMFCLSGSITSKPPLTHKEYAKRLKKFQKLPLDERKYCKTCSLLILNEQEKHDNHDITDVSSKQLFQPSTLLRHNTFSTKTIQFVTSLLYEVRFYKACSNWCAKNS